MKKFDLDTYLSDNGWGVINKKWEKGFIRIKLINDSSKEPFMIMVLNHDPRIKHQHIVTCLLPRTETEANILFELCQISNGELNK